VRNALKFVQPALPKTDFHPALRHFKITNGTVQAFNGQFGLCTPINLDLEVYPNGQDFIKAIGACGDDIISLHVANNGKLVLRSGALKVHVSCDDGVTFPDLTPQGELIPVPTGFLAALAALEPFIKDKNDAHLWATGMLFDGASAYATNNTVLLEYWIGQTLPARCNIPVAAIREVLRIGEEPESLQFADRRLTFHFSEGRWLTTQLLVAEWPDLSHILNKEDSAPQLPLPDGFFDALAQLVPFTDEVCRVFFKGDRMATIAGNDVDGATVALSGLPADGCFNAKHILNLQGIIQTIGFSSYPASVVFYGERVRGVIAGFRHE